mmetsp:Transcript_43382/g.110997  ORF Transcript_43382/g.110997 Transcript_43382/m.110997 type:complete len:251 (-) Transcript_43382:38-790(-)
MAASSSAIFRRWRSFITARSWRCLRSSLARSRGSVALRCCRATSRPRRSSISRAWCRRSRISCCSFSYAAPASHVGTLEGATLMVCRPSVLPSFLLVLPLLVLFRLLPVLGRLPLRRVAPAVVGRSSRIALMSAGSSSNSVSRPLMAGVRPCATTRSACARTKGSCRSCIAPGRSSGSERSMEPTSWLKLRVKCDGSGWYALRMIFTMSCGMPLASNAVWRAAISYRMQPRDQMSALLVYGRLAISSGDM